MKSEKIKIYDTECISACYFRSTVKPPYKKVLLQITERCNLNCQHCFVSSTSQGNEMSLEDIKNKIIPKLVSSKTIKVTLTGGEPLVHKDIFEVITLLRQNSIAVTICTNAVNITDSLISLSKELDNIHFNVSLDGFSAKSHGTFRGNNSEILFEKIISNISKLGKEGLLNGVLVTPNIYAELHEYRELTEFAKRVGANYVLFNPLSKFGRGQDSVSKGYQSDILQNIKEITQEFCDDKFETVYIRFPEKNKPIGQCPLGKVLYVFTNGDLVICPYIAFASDDRISKYKYRDFVVTNLFNEYCNLDADLLKYKLPFEEGDLRKCSNLLCQKGCYAAMISNGLSINGCDYELCDFNIS